MLSRSEATSSIQLHKKRVYLFDATSMNSFSLGAFGCSALLCDRWSSSLGMADDEVATVSDDEAATVSVVSHDEKRVKVSWPVNPEDSVKPPRHNILVAKVPAPPGGSKKETSRQHLRHICLDCRRSLEQCTCQIYMNMNLIKPLGEEAPMKSLVCSPVTCGAPSCRGCSRCLQHCICKWTNKQTQGSDSSHQRASSLGSRGFRNKLIRNTSLRN